SVGMSGANSARLLAVIASTRIFPSLISAMALPMALHAIGVWPPSSDCTIGPPPENGTTTKLSPSASLSISIESEGVVPVPGEAILYLPGSFLIMSIRVVMVGAGKFGLICQELGVAPAFVTGTK